MTSKEALDHLAQQKKFQAGAWQRVIDCGRKYGQMKAHGTYDDNGRSASAGGRDGKERMTAYLQQELLEAVDQAYAEDARMGATIDNLITQVKD